MAEKTIQELQERVKRLNLERQLKKMGGGKSKKAKSNFPESRGLNMASQLQKEINDLESKKRSILESNKQSKQGKGFFRKSLINVHSGASVLAIQKEISSRRQTLSALNSVSNLKIRTNANQKAVEYLESKNKFREMQKQQQEKFNSAFGNPFI